MSVPCDFLCDGYHEYDILTFAILREISGSDNGHCTKSLRDSFGLTTLVRFERILWGAALGRTRHTVPRLPLT